MSQTTFSTGTVVPAAWLNDIDTFVWAIFNGLAVTPTTGKILRSNGTNIVASTSTFADTYSASVLLYANGANTVVGLATANNGVLTTSGTGVPQWLASVNSAGLLTNGSGVPAWVAFTGSGAPVLAVSPALTGSPTAPTQTQADNSTKIATTAYVDNNTTSGWTTGDVKLTIKTVADSGWVLMNDTTIGDASSGGTGRANADTSALFTLLWTNTVDADCAVSTGRGGSAAADFAAHKTIALPKALGRALATYGSGSGLTARAMAKIVGEENHALTTAELAAHAHALSNASTILSSVASGTPTGGAADAGQSASIANTGSGTAHNTMQPTLFLNTMIKL